MEKTEMLEALASYYGITKNVDFAKFFGITEQAAFQQRKQGIMKFEEIYRRCPDISPDWLLNGGEGPMLRAERFENNGNVNIGANGRQVYKAPYHDSETVKKALDALTGEQRALEREQAALSKAQDQMSGLITLLQSK